MSEDEHISIVQSTAEFYSTHKDKRPKGYSTTEIEQQSASIIIKQNNTIIKYLSVISQKLDKISKKLETISTSDPKILTELDDITRKLTDFHVTPITDRIEKPKRPQWHFFQVEAKPYPKQ